MKICRKYKCGIFSIIINKIKHMNFMTLNMAACYPFNLTMGWLHMPILVPLMMPVLQGAQEIPDISTYCQCGRVSLKETSSKVSADNNGFKMKKKKFDSSSSNINEHSREDSLRVIEPETKQSKLQIADLPRKHKRKSRILQRLSSISSDSTILKEIEHISNPDEVVMLATSKSQTSKGASPRMRSRYIGICHKNGMYNAYIVANGKKTYICGTRDEELSARYYDYCAILLHGKTATTNFSYTKRQLMEMLVSGDICMNS
ncbi:unnamed protein product [Moneuplotes crassus]|uniref:AP2/ERF domain-containing protein n=1 Tax=Euplotes crassus TaxID=5936 RepID=A0AAD1Y9P2_EUPCR|nr:unnamed protein product [Moneuplotes crassus]